MENRKLWIIGDSFAGLGHGLDSWQWKIYESFIGNSVYCSSKGSRDVQTIIDIFLRNLKDIKKDDFVILVLPTMSRFRLPLKSARYDVELAHSKISGYGTTTNYIDYFAGNSFYTSVSADIERFDAILEEPLNLFDYKKFMIHNQARMINKDIQETDIGSIISMINASDASIKNMNEILKSFVEYFPFKLILHSWTDELDDSIVLTKSKIIEEIGFWHTFRDEFRETNGLNGKDDIHWSKKMDIAFANYIIEKYPEYFNKI